MDAKRPTGQLTKRDLRTQISALDMQLLALLKKRFDVCVLTCDKKEHVEDETRDNELRNLWQKEANKLKLRPEFSLSLLELILQESKRLQTDHKKAA
mgnify:CR=1 FL=1